MPDNTMIDNIAVVGQAVGVLGACWAIISGVDAWKREYVGKKRIELAEDTLVAFLELKDAVSFIRNPFSRNDEGETRKKREGETRAETELLNRGFIIYERYNTKKDIFIKFHAYKYRYMAAFGVETEKHFDDTLKAVNEIFLAAQMLATHYWPRQGRVQMTEAEFKTHLDEMHKHEGVFWEMGKDDETNAKLLTIQNSLSAILQPLLDESMKTYSIFTFSPFFNNKK